MITANICWKLTLRLELLFMLSYLIFTTTLWGKYHNYSHFTDEVSYDLERTNNLPKFTQAVSAGRELLPEAFHPD